MILLFLSEVKLTEAADLCCKTAVLKAETVDLCLETVDLKAETTDSKTKTVVLRVETAVSIQSNAVALFKECNLSEIPAIIQIYSNLSTSS